RRRSRSPPRRRSRRRGRGGGRGFPGGRGLALRSSCERVRRPRSRERQRHSFIVVAARERVVQLLQTRFLIARDEDVDLREGAVAALARLRDGLAGQLLEHGLFDLRGHLLLRLARGALSLLVELLAEEEGLARGSGGDLGFQRGERLDALRQRVAPALRIELDAQRPLLLSVDALEDLLELLAVLLEVMFQRRVVLEQRE